MFFFLLHILFLHHKENLTHIHHAPQKCNNQVLLPYIDNINNIIEMSFLNFHSLAIHDKLQMLNDYSTNFHFVFLPRDFHSLKN